MEKEEKTKMIINKCCDKDMKVITILQSEGGFNIFLNCSMCNALIMEFRPKYKEFIKNWGLLE